MTEYDFSPEAHTKFLESQVRVGRWALATEKERPNYTKPFGIRSDVGSDVGHDDDSDSESGSDDGYDTRSLASGSPNSGAFYQYPQSPSAQGMGYFNPIPFGPPAPMTQMRSHSSPASPQMSFTPSFGQAMGPPQTQQVQRLIPQPIQPVHGVNGTNIFHIPRPSATSYSSSGVSTPYPRMHWQQQQQQAQPYVAPHAMHPSNTVPYPQSVQPYGVPPQFQTRSMVSSTTTTPMSSPLIGTPIPTPIIFLPDRHRKRKKSKHKSHRGRSKSRSRSYAIIYPQGYIMG